MTKIKEMTIEECLKTLSSEEIENIYQEIPIELRQTKKKITLKEKKDIIITSIPVSFMAYCITLTDKQMNQLETLMDNQDFTNSNTKILEKPFIFLIDDTYVIPKEIKEIYQQVDQNELQSRKKDIATFFYIMVNGVIEISNLIKLLKETGINTTKQEIIEYAKSNGFIIEGELIYLDDNAKSLDECYSINDAKKTKDYKIFSIQELYINHFEIEKANYNEKINKLLAKSIKNKNKRIEITNVIMDLFLAGYNYKEEIINYLEEEDVILNERTKRDLFDLADEYHLLFPSWELNGYAAIEIDDDINFENLINYKQKFTDLTKEEQIEAYIHTYLILNSIIEVDKLLDILNTNHNLNITKKALIKHTNNIEDLVLCNNYICIEGTEELINEIMPLKNTLNQYKIIDNIDELMDQLWEIKYNIINTCLKYDLNEETINGIEQFINMTGAINEEMVESIITEEGQKLSHKNIKELTKELSIIQKDARIWIYNGFKKSELTNLNKKEKIGRNDICPCGSGKKYKKCCGK